MDVYRTSRDQQVFEALVAWTAPQLRTRIRARLRTLGCALDPSEVWQDTIVNVYRYPDRFLASRPGAFGTNAIGAAMAGSSGCCASVSRPAWTCLVSVTTRMTHTSPISRLINRMLGLSPLKDPIPPTFRRTGFPFG